uniref:Uncharacterized protein n=1 Tax=Timema poppense TaxID=170557 RepID=A0A7R9H1T6_TIMPO|nr:unnamed protein product [Timema poppensis]
MTAKKTWFGIQRLRQSLLVTTYITTINYLNSLLPPTCPIPNSAPFGKTIEQQKQTLEQQQAAIAVVAASSASLEPTGHMLAASQPPQQPALPQAPPPHQNNDLIPPGRLRKLATEAGSSLFSLIHSTLLLQVMELELPTLQVTLCNSNTTKAPSGDDVTISRTKINLSPYTNSTLA